MPSTTLIRVDFPTPFGPIMQTYSGSSMRKDTPPRTSLPSPYPQRTSFTEIIGMHRTFFCLMMSHRNSGPPMNAVITPTCMTAFSMRTLPTTSAIVRSAAPKAAEAGIRNLLSEPMTRRETCGPTRPTNPMRPVKLTTPAARNETTRRQRSLSWLASTPIERELSSPVERTLSRRERSWSTANPASTMNVMV